MAESNEEPRIAVELRNVSKVFGGVKALDDVSIRVRAGEVFGYVGRNGAGKTTSIKILTGLLQPTAGEAFVDGASVRTHPLETKAKLGYVPESGALFEKFSPVEYLSLIGQLHRLPEQTIDERRERWLAYFGLGAERHRAIGGLSKGTRQKVCWIAALIHDPSVLFLDEPLNGLDVEAVARVKELMLSLTAQGRTVFYSSHLMDIVAKVCTGIAVLDRGKVVAHGTVDDVVAGLGGASLEEGLLRLGAA